MILDKKTLEKLRLLINEDIEYRSGAKLVKFFNNLGFQDSYGQGFPSRWRYTDEKLDQINGTPKLEVCIKEVFSPKNFINQVEELDKHIADFNQYISFDKWKVVRNGAEISFKKLDKIEYDESSSSNHAEDDFLKRDFSDVSVTELGLEENICNILQLRISEIEKCYTANAWLSVILLAGSILEGIFLSLAKKYPSQFNAAKSSPKDKENKVEKFHDWKLANFIDVSKELELIQHDTYKFSHSLREFRNYIHPYQQWKSRFSPRERTATICLHVLRAAIYDIRENIGKL